MLKPFSSVFPNPHRASEVLSEERVRKSIDALLNYRRREVLLMSLLLWCVFLFMVFTLLITIRFAFLIF